jgi:hypothetical protein
VIRNQPTGEPHHLNVAASLTLKPAARLNPIEITVNVELQQHRRMVRRPAGGLGINPVKPKLGQIEPPDKDINHANRIILANPIFQAFRKQGALPAIHPLNKAHHPIPPQIAQESYPENPIDPRVFTRPGSNVAGWSGRAIEPPKVPTFRAIPLVSSPQDVSGFVRFLLTNRTKMFHIKRSAKIGADTRTLDF